MAAAGIFGTTKVRGCLSVHCRACTKPHLSYGMTGLGTSTAKEAKEYFAALAEHKIPFEFTEGSDDRIELAFAKKRVNDRKTWLSGFKPGTYVDYGVDTMAYDEFVDKELILFSMADNIRSIPSMVRRASRCGRPAPTLTRYLAGGRAEAFAAEGAVFVLQAQAYQGYQGGTAGGLRV